MSKKNKYYAIYNKTNKFLYGAFPHTAEGFKLAKDYLKKISSKKSIKDFKIKSN